MSELAKRIQESMDRIGEMCIESRPPKMSIPAQPTDDDLFITETLKQCAAALERGVWTDEQIMAIVCRETDTLDCTRVSEMTNDGWKATTIFEGDAALLRCIRAVLAAAALERGVWVPAEPTEEMLQAGYDAALGHNWPDDWSKDGTTPELYTAIVVWKAMLAAAPVSYDEKLERDGKA
jgi:hypothetical protein